MRKNGNLPNYCDVRVISLQGVIDLVNNTAITWKGEDLGAEFEVGFVFLVFPSLADNRFCGIPSWLYWEPCICSVNRFAILFC